VITSRKIRYPTIGELRLRLGPHPSWTVVSVTLPTRIPPFGTPGALCFTRTRTVRLGRPIWPSVSAASTTNWCIPGDTATRIERRRVWRYTTPSR
jgi:hypothetical protein